MSRHLMSLLSLLLACLISLPLQAEITTISSAINKAGRQRMLTQRMVKCYTMIGIEVQKETAEGQLHDAIALFDQQLRELKAYAPSTTIRDSLAKVETLWHPFKEVLQLPVNRDSARILLDTNDELLRASNKVVLQLQDLSGSSVGRIVNISGRQRMLSQRLAKFYMLRAWQFDNAEVRSEMERARLEFKGALAELQSAKENSPAVREQLKEAAKQWELFNHGLERNKEQLVPLIVAMSSEKLLNTMNNLTGMYETLANK